jgi:hypothetical protein
MKRSRSGLSSLLWLVALVAAFLGGIRYEQSRAAARRAKRAGRHRVAAPAEVANLKVRVDRGD